MADMDDLKPVNDELGHAAGDRAIAAVAGVIRAELRETDFGARYGGDEFVLLLPHTGGDEGRVLAERICAPAPRDGARGGGPARPAPRVLRRRVPRPSDAADAADTLVRAADAALYRAKRAGRGRVEVAFHGDRPRSPPARRRERSSLRARGGALARLARPRRRPRRARSRASAA